MEKKRSKGKGIALLAILLMITLVGCIGQEETNEILYNTQGNSSFGTMDPALVVGEADLTGAINTHSPLVHPDMEHNSLTPVAHVAESWSLSTDRTVYTFNLRDDIKFHDGTDLLAEDVVYSAERFLRVGQGFSWTWAGVLEPGNIVATDDHTVEFRLNQPYAPFVATLEVFFIVNKGLLMENQETGDYGEFGDYGLKYMESNDAGSGPYKLDSWTRGEIAVFVKFDDYFRGWSGNSIDRVIYRIISEEATGVLVVKTGDADQGIQWFSLDNHESLDAEEHISTIMDPSTQLFHLPMNTKIAPTDDLNFRYAICYAFDYDTAINDIQGGAPQAEGPVPNEVPGHSDDVMVFQQDMDKAKEYLAKSKYAPDEYVLDYTYVEAIEVERKIGLLLQANLDELGIEVKINARPWASIVELSSTIEQTPHFTAIYDTLKFPHIDSHTWGLYHSTIPNTYRSVSHYSNPTVDTLLEDAREAPTEAESLQKYKEAQDIITSEAPSIYVFNTPHRVEMWDYVTGYTYVGLLGYDYSWWYLKIDTDKRDEWVGGGIGMQALVINRRANM